jgi:hypothetical protein
VSKGGHSGVTFFLSRSPSTPIAAESPNILADLDGMSLGLLQAEDVGLKSIHKTVETLFMGGSDSIDIPRYDFQGELLHVR